MVDVRAATVGRSTGRTDLILSFTVPGLMLVAPFVGAVRQVHHSILSADSVTAIAILLAIGAVAGVAIRHGGRVRVVTLAAFLTVALDLMLKGTALSQSLPQRLFAIPLAPFFVATSFVIVLAVCHLLRAELLRILASGFAVATVAALIGPVGGTPIGHTHTKAHVVSKPGRPLVLHLILDEHIGIDGIPTDLPGGRELRQTLTAFYDEFGFRLYRRSFSPYVDTRDSLPNLFNFGRQGVAAAFLTEPEKLFEPPYVLSRNDYFERLKALGYRIRVYESTFLDVCRAQAAPIADCYIYPEWGFESARRNLSLTGRLRLLSTAYLQDSLVYRTAKIDVLQRLHRRFPGTPVFTWERANSGPLTSLPTLQLLEKDLTTARPGEAYVAHLLMPHNPYVYEADCAVRDPADWRSIEDTGALLLTDLDRRDLYDGYFRQMSCLYKRLHEMFVRLRESGRLNDAVVIVHGDHGSRIAAPRRGRWRRQDYVAMYSTIFAVKAPGVQPGHDDSFHSVHHLFAQLWNGQSSDPPVIYVPEDADPAELEPQPVSNLGWE